MNTRTTADAPALFIPGSAGETFGRVLRTRRTGRFVFRESRYPSALSLPPHFHSRPYFTYVVDGALRERDDRAEHHYPAGSVHFHPPGDPHSGRMADGGTTCLSIIVAEEVAGPLAAPGRGSLRNPARSPAARLARRCHRELRARGSASDLVLEGLALELVALAIRDRTPGGRPVPGWLLAVRDHLHARFQEPVRLAELSGLAGIHEVHLVRAFRRHFGATPGAYVRGLRIDHARRALIDSDATIADLALAAGFSSQSHFTRLFHRALGATPAAYRRRRSRPV